MRLKALLLGGISAILVLAMAACSSGGSSPAGTSGGGSQSSSGSGSKAGASGGSGSNVTLRFTWWGDTNRNKKYNAIDDMFTKQYPNVKVNGEPMSWNDYWDKLATETAGGNAPDVMGMHFTKVADYARRGALLDLSPYIKSGVIDLSNFPKPVQDVGVVDGKTLMVAQGVTMTGYIENTGVLKQLGVQAPDFNWTWSDFEKKAVEVAQAFKAKGIQGWGSTDNSGSETDLEVFARQRGKNLYTSDGKLGVNKQDMVDWFTIWANLRKQGAVPDGATTQQYSTVSLDQSLFVKGKVAFMSLPFNQIPNYQVYIKNGEVDALRRPTDPNGKNGEFIEGAYLSVAKTSKHPKEAAEFINFFVNNPDAAKTFLVEQGAQGSTKNNELIKPLLDDAQNRAIDAIQKTLKIAGSLPLPPAGEGEVIKELSNDAQAVQFGKMTIDQAAQQFVTKAQSILNQ